jgi:hypothetical protein
MSTELKIIERISNRIHQKIISFQKVDKRWTKNLRGACATSSVLLYKSLQKKGIKSWMIHASHKSNLFGNHMWVETDNYLIDITYSQFNETEKIVILSKQEPRFKSYYKNFFNILPMDLDSLDIFKWPASQDPVKCTERMKKVQR